MARFLCISFSRFIVFGRLLCFSLDRGMCSICHDLFVLSISVNGGLCSVIVTIPGRLLYHLS